MEKDLAAWAANPPLLYRAPEPLDALRHGSMGLRTNFGLSFAARVNAVPINLVEMPEVAHVYPIAFRPDGTPVAVLGGRDGENRFVDANGAWLPDTYIPAYVRRYPFLLIEQPGTDQLVLCIDNDPAVLDPDGGQQLFEAGGKPSALTQKALEFCMSYHAGARQTADFAKALAASGLLVAGWAGIPGDDHERAALPDLMSVDPQRLVELPDAEFLESRRRGWLPFLYAHLSSMTQWRCLRELLRQRLEGAAWRRAF